MIKHRLFWSYALGGISACAALLTLFTVLFKMQFIKDCITCGIIGVIIVFGTSLIYAGWQVHSKNEISMVISSSTKLTIKVDDIFAQKGIICIPVNEYFDTHVGDGVISEASLHGKFINKYYKDRIQELNNKIQNELQGLAYTVHSRRRSDCPNKQYPLGTCVDIRDGENTYVLFALTHFDDYDTANVSRAEYGMVVNELMKHIFQIAENKPVYISLFGTGFSRIQRSPQRILYQLISILDFDDRNVFTGGINIILNSHMNNEDDKDNDINLTVMEHIIKNGITK